MNENQHPSGEDLSAWIDTDLAHDEQALIARHLEGCAACSRAVEELRAVVHAAGKLEDRAPDSDLWVELSTRLENEAAPRRKQLSPWIVLLVGVAAGLLCMPIYRGLTRPAAVTAPGERFALLLHESPELLADATPSEVQAVMERYRNWSLGLARAGKLLGGEKLADGEGRWLRDEGGEARVQARGERGGVGGFFLIRAKDYDEALEISLTCPHLGPEGWIELRRLEDT